MEGTVDEMPDIGPVNGILIYTAQLEPMLRFYRDVLGLEPRHVKDRTVNFAWRDFKLTIGLHDEVSGRNGDPLRLMVNFHVDDIHAVHRRLHSTGVEFSRPPEQEPWGGWIATFADPDGNTLQLLQPR
jgi:predicted enzyme related to lactoylglutathione lyase